MWCVLIYEISLLLQGILENRRDFDVCRVLTGWKEEWQLNKENGYIDLVKINGNSGTNCVQNILCNTSTLLEQPLLLYIIVTGVWSECNIFGCYLCTGNWCIFIKFVMCENTDITLCYVTPKDYHIVVSVCCTLHVIKSQCMQQLVDNCSMPYASVALEVQLLLLWVIENLWLTVVRKERNLSTQEAWLWLESLLNIQ